MKLTPIDIQQQTFSKRFRGVDRREVSDYLELIAHQFEETMKENRNLKEELRLLNRELSSFREREQALKETMVTAQKVTDELKEQGKKEAQIVISEAELKAEKIMNTAHSRMVNILEDINELKRQRTQFIESIRGMVNTHGKLLDLAEEGETGPNVENNVSIFKKLEPPAPAKFEYDDTKRQVVNVD